MAHVYVDLHALHVYIYLKFVFSLVLFFKFAVGSFDRFLSAMLTLLSRCNDIQCTTIAAFDTSAELSRCAI